MNRILLLSVLLLGCYISIADLILFLPNGGKVDQDSIDKAYTFINKLQTGFGLEKVSPNQTALQNDDLSLESPYCLLCRFLMDAIINLRKLGIPAVLYKLGLGLICQIFQSTTFCTGILDTNLDIILFIIGARPNITSKTICGLVQQGNNCVAGDDENLNWQIKISPPGAKAGVPPPSADDLTIVQITDIHYDPKYKVGSLVSCKEPLCCRTEPKEGVKLDASSKAGRWGEYQHCDTSLAAVDNVFSTIYYNTRKIDYIYVTGDYVDHAVWETSRAGNVAAIKTIFKSLKYAFSKHTPVYPIIGNHEPHPVNQFAPSEITTDSLNTLKLYNELADIWFWLPESAKQTIRTGGYYTVLARPGLRIIALNNNDACVGNFWLFYDSRIVAPQLQWLHDTLLLAEQNNENVHILGHIPPGAEDMFRTYTREYHRIVQRFYKTISAQFTGHTHKDEFNVFYDLDNPNRAINVAWNGGSVTTFEGVNPNYRLYSVEPKHFQVTNHETWIYNLTEANTYRYSGPTWFKEYSFLETYGLKDLSPSSLDELLDRFASDKNLLQLYWQYKIKSSDYLKKIGCDNKCLIKELCSIPNTLARVDSERCKQFKKVFWDKNI